MGKRNLLVVQSGGPTCVINSSLAGVVSEAKKNPNINKIYGSIGGVGGIIKDNLIELDFSDDDIKILKTTPAAYLGSTRYVLGENYLDHKFNLSGEYSDILRTVKYYDIGYICFIGGNDSMDTVNKLSKFFEGVKYPCNVIGVPKTIDNDLVLIDHTPGYGSAIKYIATTIAELKLDTSVYNRGRVTIVEIMGRDSGWLTAGSKLASLNGVGPDLIYLPEITFNMEKFLKDVKELYDKNKKVLVAVSEGLKDANGKYILNQYMYNELNDVFGHQQLGGLSTVLASIVNSRLGLPVRNIEFNLMQRCAAHIASNTDVEEAFACGVFAANNVTSTSGKFVTMNRKDSDNYELEYSLVDVKDVANKVKTVPVEWIIDGKDLTDDFVKYALPLIQGEVNHFYENGMIKYIKR